MKEMLQECHACIEPGPEMITSRVLVAQGMSIFRMCLGTADDVSSLVLSCADSSLPPEFVATPCINT